MSSPIDLSAAQARNIAARASRALKHPCGSASGSLAAVERTANRLANLLENLPHDAEAAFYEANP